MNRVFLTLFLFTFFYATFTPLNSLAKVDEGTFEENVLKWLNGIGFNGKINDLSKTYDEDGFIDVFYIDLEENLPEARTNPNIFGMITSDQGVQEMNFRILKKDLKGTPYLYFDWMAKYAINSAIKKFGGLLGLDFALKDMPDGSVRAEIKPAKTSIKSRYRFEYIIAQYSVNDLILDIDVKVFGPNGYLISEFVKGEVNGILRSCENDSTPLEDTIFGRTSLGSVDSTFSDRLLKGVLQSLTPAEFEKALKSH